LVFLESVAPAHDATAAFHEGRLKLAANVLPVLDERPSADALIELRLCPTELEYVIAAGDPRLPKGT